MRAFGQLPSTLLLSCLLVGSACADTILVAAGSVWSYLDDGSDPGPAWTDPAFDDEGWPEGPAQLGYGDGDEATVVGYGTDPDDKHVTTYFRRTFAVADPGAFVAAQLDVLRDDGVVVHLNGDEVYRSNMTAEPVTTDTYAVSAVGGDNEDLFHTHLLESGLLETGTNLMAVEIHQANATSSDISFDLRLLGLTEVPNPIFQAPHLIYEGANTEMKVVWRMSWDVPATLSWGPDETCGQGSVQTAEYGTRHMHAHTITGLAPDTRYHYLVAAGLDTLRGDFRTAPPADATTLKFTAYGDTRTFPENHDLVAGAMLQTLEQDEAFRSLSLFVGDFVSDGDRETDWHVELFEPGLENIRNLFAALPIQACMGNHEESGVLFAEFFPYPFVDDRYWSFDYGPAHFAIVDQYVSYSPGSPQIAWLESDLAASDKPWKFVVLHEPGWSAGGGHENDALTQATIWPLCLAHDVAMVFAGHNHYYARAEVEGIQNITTGGGGAPFHTPGPESPHLVTATPAFHFCKVEIDGAELTFTAETPEGTVIDTFTMSRPTVVEGPGDEPPSAVLQPAYPNPFNAATTIAWSQTAAGAATVEIYDLAGRRVRSLGTDVLAAGDHALVWDGRSDAGRELVSGLYHFTLRTGDVVRGGRVVLVK